MHALGYFSKVISPEEKAFFLESLREYGAGRIPLSAPAYVLRAWMLRSNEKYLLGQTFFRRYPEELVETTDTGKGKDVWSR